MTKLSRAACLSLALIPVALASGCARTGGTEPAPAAVASAAAPARPVKPAYDATAELPESLRRDLQVRDYSFEPGENPVVSLRFFNSSQSGDIAFAARTVFYRSDGSVVDATQWSDIVVHPRSSASYRAASFSPWAVREEVQLRLP